MIVTHVTNEEAAAYTVIRDTLDNPAIADVARLAIIMAVYREEPAKLSGEAFQIALNAMEESAQEAWDVAHKVGGGT